MDTSNRSCRKARALPFRGDVGAWKSSLSGTDQVLPDVMVYNYMPIVYISITAGVKTTHASWGSDELPRMSSLMSSQEVISAILKENTVTLSDLLRIT